MPTNDSSKQNNKKMPIRNKEKTTLHLNNSRKTSLRTTVPAFIVKDFELQKGGMLEWNIQTIKGQMVAVVKKIE